MRSEEAETDYMLHDLRVQMQMVMWDTDWIIRQANGAPVFAGDCDVTNTLLGAQRNIETACALLGTLLERGYDGQDGSGDVCALRPLAERVIGAVAAGSASLGRKCGLDVLGEPVAAASPAKVERILYNLLSNAVRHTPKGSLVRLAIRAEGDGIHILVEDQGAGLDGAERALLQDANGLAEYKGRGMGLRIVRTLADQMAGQVAVEGGEGRGAIRVILPARPPEPQAGS